VAAYRQGAMAAYRHPPPPPPVAAYRHPPVAAYRQGGPLLHKGFVENFGSKKD
jgi:hypothetical protein